MSDIEERIVEFFATLDLGAEGTSIEKSAWSFPIFLTKVFGSEEVFWMMAQKVQDEESTAKDRAHLAKRLSSLLRGEPSLFLVLMHLHRQIRFTNTELVNFFFDHSRLNEVVYYEAVAVNDPQFQSQIVRVGLRRESFAHQPTDLEKLASYKKAVSRYAGPVKSCWPLWRSRIEHDASVAERIITFLLGSEDLGELIRDKQVIPALRRSLRIVNVELVKRARGDYAARRIENVLEDEGVRFTKLSGITELREVEKAAKGLGRGWWYTKEKLWKSEDKRFDYVLLANRHIQYVVELNYFTTSMSKIREVVAHFKELRKLCRGRYRLLYVTDGLGWFALAKSVRGMFEFERKEREVEKSDYPFLLNLELFRRSLPSLESMALSEGR